MHPFPYVEILKMDSRRHSPLLHFLNAEASLPHSPSSLPRAQDPRDEVMDVLLQVRGKNERTGFE